ncbi:putative O-linked N-acetylglucosamine transferase (SPINDLY family) [Paenibacillus castaneae]|uniref:hypothetical protein n=1 Tax=Paenibacillus castaneae TaxID=474957 RepID=UPI000C9A4D3A|nr:hypothetical protein [Paenibacillus castaneae]NIK80262.1 putative O-linked N-acetylglucosamine transferase (SPINDLY family) [Paenibacillus castaneae]
MRQPLTKAIVLVCLLCIFCAASPYPTADAGFFDRIKDIYNTPEKISELESQYLDAKAALAEQQQQLEESLQAAEEYARQQQELLEQNEKFRLQNEQLIAQNASLQAEVEKAKQDKQSFIRKFINTIIIIVAIFAAYIIALRVWRYLVWRKQTRAGRRGISG